MSLSPFDSFQSRFVIYLLNFPRSYFVISELWWKGIYFFEKYSRVGYGCILTFRNALAVPDAE